MSKAQLYELNKKVQKKFNAVDNKSSKRKATGKEDV